MKSRCTKVLILIMCVSLLFVNGCSSARRGAPVAGLPGPTSTQVERGQVAFDQHCNTCHVGGAAGLGPAINNKPLPGWLIRFQVRHGLGAMPSFSETQISDGELDAIVSYLKALRQQKWPNADLSVETR